MVITRSTLETRLVVCVMVVGAAFDVRGETRPRAVVPPLKHCMALAEDSDGLVVKLIEIHEDVSGTLVEDPERELDPPMLSGELVAAYNRRRLLHPQAPAPALLVVDVLASKDTPIDAVRSWLLTALGGLDPSDLKRVRLMLVGRRQTGLDHARSPEDICGVPLPVSALRAAAGTWRGLADALSNREGFPLESAALSADDMLECFRRAERFYRDVCDRGAGKGCQGAGFLLLHRDPIRDVKTGQRLLDRGCKLNDREACRNLADYLFESGAAVRASSFLRKACDLGDLESCTDLADRMLYGNGLRQDVDGAWRLLQVACDKRESRACFLMKAPEFQGHQ